MARVRLKSKDIEKRVGEYRSNSPRKNKEGNRLKPVRGNVVRLFLDSGAFGAWARGQELPIKDYIRYCIENEKYIWKAVCLDQIPGKFGRRDNSQAEAEIAAEQSYKNQQRMKDAGVRPIPVFHQGDPITFLERYIADGEDYIGLSCNKFVRIEEQKRWLDSIFNLLTDKSGRPIVRTHGFALTAFPHMVCYPWYTVDSTTWSLTPGYGQIIIPAWRDGKWDYLHEPTRIAISGVTHKSVSSQKKQFESFGHGADVSEYRKSVEKFLEEVVGTSISEVRYGTNERRKAMLIYYRELCNALRDVRYTGSRGRITGPDHLDLAQFEALSPFNLILMFATSLNREWSELMTAVGANDRLLSYWEMRTRSNDILQEYVATGTHGVYRKSKLRQDWSETYLNRRRLALLARIRYYNELGEGDPIVLEELSAAIAEKDTAGLRS